MDTVMTPDPIFTSRDPLPAPGWLVFDCESIPDGKLLNIVKYPSETLAAGDAVARAQAEAREKTGSDFLPVTFQLPIAIGMLRIGADFSLQALACLDWPAYRPRSIIEQFWSGLAYYHENFDGQVKLVTFNGRGFDLPLLEVAAFRYGLSAPAILGGMGRRYNDRHFDLMDWLNNHGAIRLSGGLNLLAKMLGKPGKMEVTGKQVYPMWLEGKINEINDYCLCDTLDTYFVFLRTRVMAGSISLENEQALIRRAKDWLRTQTTAWPALAEYVTHWGDWQPWP
jgi:predicted PolB exonuclease-like 3'-5' exonuclease